MMTKIPRTVAGWDSILASLKLAWRAGGWPLFKALLSKNTCKSCALGMGGQQGGLRDEQGRFPQVCKKSFFAQASDMQAEIPLEFFARHSVATLRTWTPLQLEHAGRLTRPLLLTPDGQHYRAISWEEALDLVVDRLQAASPERTFFYASGRSSNEAGFLLQLLARNFGTNNVNNCSYYCHQASGVGLTESLGTSTATVQLDDLDQSDLIFLIGANPASNHPRFMRNLLDVRRRGGKVIVVNPARERGLENFSVPSEVRSLLFGSEIASTYVQPHIGGDRAFMKGVAKALFNMDERKLGVIDAGFIEEHTEGFEIYKRSVTAASWPEIESESGVSRDQMESVAGQYADANNVVFVWAMGITHHAHGVDNVQSIVNLSLLRGMLGRRYAGLLPLRGHSNVQGIGTVGVTPQLKKEFLDNLESLYGIKLPVQKGLDTLACVESAGAGLFDFAWNLGGNLFGSNPDSKFAEAALGKIGFILYMNTTLNQTHFQGRGQTTLVLPVQARDEEPEPTTQESMFSYVRLSEGGPARYAGPRSEVRIIAEVARRVLKASAIPWAELAATRNIRQVIGRVVKGMQKISDIDVSREEFHIEGRILHEPKFSTASGKARFKVSEKTVHKMEAKPNHHFLMMTVRSEGQFNTVVYENFDKFRGVDCRNVVLMNPADITALGWRDNDTVTVKNGTGTLAGQKLVAYPIRSRNIMMYYPEANVLVPRTHDLQSRTPAFKSIAVQVEKDN